MSDKENKHTLLKVIGVTAAAAGAAYAGFGYYVFRNAFDLEHSGLYTEANGIRKASAVAGEKSEWFAHSTRNDEFLDSFDGLKLHAMRITNYPDSHRWVILVHGLGSYSGGMLDYMYEADHREYNVLAIDNRGCGMSEGKYTGLGWSEHYDLISWINYLIGIDENAEIALFGLRTGASAVMNAAGDYIPSNVKCAVEDGGYSSIKGMLTSGIRRWCKVDGKPFIPSVDFYVKQCLHFSVGDVSTKHQLKQSAVPMLFVHGSEDDVIPTSNVFDCYYSCASAKELYVVDNAGFAQTAEDPEYYDRTFGFIDRFMK